MASDLTFEEQAEAYRSAIVVLLSLNPLCPLANMMGQHLMDLYDEL